MSVFLELPDYPTWSGDPRLAPGEPSQAYIWNGTEWVLQYPYLTADGSEVNDPVPMEPPVGYQKQPSLQDQIRMMVLSEKLRLEVEAAGAETFEEADDFDVGDDFDPSSPWENDFDPDYSEIRSEVERLRAKGVNVPESVDAVLNPPEEPVRQDPQPKKARSSKAEEKQPESEE